MPQIKMQLRGGLGNQLFQVLAMNFFSRKLSCLAQIDDRAIIRHSDTARRSWLRKIDVERMFDNCNLNWTNKVITRIRSRLPDRRNFHTIVNEEELASLTSLDDTIRVVGWFQTSHYLPEKKIRLEREFLYKISPKILDFGERIQSDNIGAIHIRLGDFKQTSWGTLPDSWYKKATKTLIESGIERLDIYSDEIEDAKRILKDFRADVKFQFPEEVETRNPIELLWILSSYSKFISSNSSLSWWSSYLNRNLSSLIISPWSNDLLIPGWLKQ